MKRLEVLFTPADFAALKERDLNQAVCVVFDVLRATSTIVTALANGAAGVLPVANIPAALAVRAGRPEVLLAGERDGMRIRSSLTGGIDFDLGNSPREFSRERVLHRTIVMTTTNGTRALTACANARRVLACSLLNLRATAEFLKQVRPDELLAVCSGTGEQAAYEDALGAGALCELVLASQVVEKVADSALMACRLFQMAGHDLPSAFSASSNGRRLLAIPELQEDVGYCAQVDKFSLVADLGKDGHLRAQGDGPQGG